MPGHVTPEHRKIEADCLACHRDGTEHGGRRESRGNSDEGPLRDGG